MPKPGIMIAIGKPKGPSMPPPPFGKAKDDAMPPMDDQPDDETGEADAMKRIEDKVDQILALIQNDGGEQGEQPDAGMQSAGMPPEMGR